MAQLIMPTRNATDDCAGHAAELASRECFDFSENGRRLLSKRTAGRNEFVFTRAHV